MRTYKPKEKKYTKLTLTIALNDIKKSKCSIRAASRKYNIPKTVLAEHSRRDSSKYSLDRFDPIKLVTYTNWVAAGKPLNEQGVALLEDKESEAQEAEVSAEFQIINLEADAAEQPGPSTSTSSDSVFIQHSNISNASTPDSSTPSTPLETIFQKTTPPTGRPRNLFRPILPKTNQHSTYSQQQLVPYRDSTTPLTQQEKAFLNSLPLEFIMDELDRRQTGGHKLVLLHVKTNDTIFPIVNALNNQMRSRRRTDDIGVAEKSRKRVDNYSRVLTHEEVIEKKKENRGGSQKEGRGERKKESRNSKKKRRERKG